MARPRKRDAQQGFGGGLNLSFDPLSLRPDEFRMGRNARLGFAQDIARRGPTRRVSVSPPSSGNAVTAGYSWREATFVREYAFANGTLYQGTLGLPMAWSSVGTSMIAGARAGMTNFLDGASARCLYVADGGPLNKLTEAGTFTGNLAGTPDVLGLCVYNRRLVGWTGQDEFLYLSDLDNGDTLGIVGSGGIVARVRTFSNQQIVTAKPLGDTLMLYHVSGISRFTGYSIDDIDIDAGAQGVSGDTGTIAGRAILEIEGRHYFPAERGFFGATPAGVQPIASPLETLLDGIDASDFSGIEAVHNRAKREAMWVLPGRGAYIWQYRLNRWSGPWDGTVLETVTAAWETRDSQKRPAVLLGGDDGIVRWLDAPNTDPLDDVLSDNTGGDTIELEVQCHRMAFGDETRETVLRDAWVTAEWDGVAVAQLTWSTDIHSGQGAIEGVVGGVWDESEVWDETETWETFQQRPIRVGMNGLGPTADLTILDTSRCNVKYSRVVADGFDMGVR